jgi:hypothetical protein
MSPLCSGKNLVLPEGIELSTSPLPRGGLEMPKPLLYLTLSSALQCRVSKTCLNR